MKRPILNAFAGLMLFLFMAVQVHAHERPPPNDENTLTVQTYDEAHSVISAWFAARESDEDGRGRIAERILNLIQGSNETDQLEKTVRWLARTGGYVFVITGKFLICLEETL